MHGITFLSGILVTLALAVPGAAEEPDKAAEQSPAELVEQLDRYHGEFTERLQQQLEGRMTTQLSNVHEPTVRSRHAASATRVTVARSR
jgi:hypothetical protein